MDNNTIFSLNKKSILILNRRCIKHPQKGGAEVYTYQMALFLAQRGFKVSWFSSKAKNLPSQEQIEGIEFIRKGNELTTHFWGFLYALRKQHAIIIDEFNGIGFFTFLLKKRNIILLIHQLYREFWSLELGSWGIFFNFLEKFFLKFYKKKITITVSPSTKKDLKKLGFKNIHIVYNGLEINPLSTLPSKAKNLILIYLGRLKKTKNPEDAIKCFLKVKKVYPKSKLWIVGDGPLRTYLQKKYSAPDIIFFGYVGEQKKITLLKKSHFLLIPSIREGWGQVVIQANALGTPAIGYKVPGLIDSIKHGETGYLVNNYQEMATTLIQVWNNLEQYMKLAQSALNWAKNFSWTKSQQQFFNLIQKSIL